MIRFFSWLLIFLFQLSFAYAGEFRVISLAPSISEIMYFLGEEDKLVGVTTIADYPNEVTNLPKIGGYSNPNLERILALNPTHLFTTSTTSHPVYEQLRNLGYVVNDYKADTIDDIFIMITDVAEQLKVKDSSPIEELKSKYSVLSQQLNSGVKKKVLVLMWDNPLFTVGCKSYINEIIELSGAENVFKDVEDSYFKVDVESIVKRDPDCILLLMMDNRSGVINSPILNEYMSNKNGTIIHELNPDKFLRAGPRVIEAAWELRERLNEEK